jgi:hypothetical protein
LPDTGETQQGGSQTLLSRRQILTGTSVGIGATLLFHHTARNRVDVPPRPRPTPPPSVAARPTTPVQEGAGPAAGAAGGATDGGATAQAPSMSTVATRPRAIHRSQLADHGQPRAVAKGPRGVLVMGMSDDGEPLGWLTEDGEQWVEHTLAAAEHQMPEVWGVASYGGDYVAVGTTVERSVRRIAESGIVPGPDTQVTYIGGRRAPTVWRSSDCVNWSGQSFEDVVGPHADLIAVASDGERLVAVGGILDDDGAQTTRGLVLTSTDGATWRRADIDDDAAFTEGAFTGITVGDDAWYATSVDIDGGAVWRSPDGWRWTVVDGSRDAFRGLTLQGIGVDRGRLLVAGSGLFDPEPRYFVSRNGGRTWRRAQLDLAMLAGSDALVTDLAVIAGDIVVVGTHRSAPVLEGGTLYVGD